MPAPKFSEVRHEYEELFDSCIITKPLSVKEVVDPILKHRSRYEAVAKTSGVPWYVIAVIHNMECGLDFRAHLHNGDPLKKKTTHDPAGRPPKWNATGTWEDSALGALAYDGLTHWDDWSIAGICYKLESYNGWGSRRHRIHTPYLWSFTNHYTCGKYVADHVWSESAVSKQCGCAAVLRRLAELGTVAFGERPIVSKAALPVIHYSPSKPTQSADIAATKSLQQWLSTFPGIFLSVDGVAGPRTSDAFKLVTGYYLQGDPRV